MKIGIGYDIHRLVRGRKMILGGVEIDCDRGPEGHSDADVLLHAVCDAILGALGEDDIGTKFPDTDPEHKDRSSIEFLKTVRGIMDSKGFKISNLDAVVVTEEPKISPYRKKISEKISGILNVDPSSVNVKGKTREGLGEVGRGEAIASYSTVLLKEK